MKINTVFTYGLVAGSGWFCLSHFQTSDLFALPVITYGLLITHSCCGMLKYMYDSNSDVDEIFTLTEVLVVLFSFPSFVGQLWINYQPSWVIGLLHPAISVVPFLNYTYGNVDDGSFGTLLNFNTISCVLVSVLMENWYGLIAAGMFTVARSKGCRIKKIAEVDVRNILTCVCVFCTLFALKQTRRTSEALLPALVRVTIP